ncbi:hypothetical protein CLF_112188, partial [Clonorchis sinensis]
MRRPGAAHSVAWKHHKGEIQLDSSDNVISISDEMFAGEQNFNQSRFSQRTLGTFTERNVHLGEIGRNTQKTVMPDVGNFDKQSPPPLTYKGEYFSPSNPDVTEENNTTYLKPDFLEPLTVTKFQVDAQTILCPHVLMTDKNEYKVANPCNARPSSPLEQYARVTVIWLHEKDVPPDGSLVTEIFSGSPSLDRSNGGPEIGFEPRTFRLKTVVSHPVLVPDRIVNRFIPMIGQAVSIQNDNKPTWFRLNSNLDRMSDKRSKTDSSALLGNLAVSQPSCFLRVARQLGTERVLQLNSLNSTLVPAATVSTTGKRECGTYNEALEAK